jgi:gas vesicle protein
MRAILLAPRTGPESKLCDCWLLTELLQESSSIQEAFHEGDNIQKTEFSKSLSLSDMWKDTKDLDSRVLRYKV